MKNLAGTYARISGPPASSNPRLSENLSGSTPKLVGPTARSERPPRAPIRPCGLRLRVGSAYDESIRRYPKLSILRLLR
jgi:hypothetical protein